MIPITPSHCIGDLKGVPPEIVSKMLEYQKKQTGQWDLEIFQKCRLATTTPKKGQYNEAKTVYGGFRWELTEEGYMFWAKVLSWRRYDLFHKKFGTKKAHRSDGPSMTTHTLKEKSTAQI